VRSLPLKVLGVGTVLGLALLTCVLPVGASQEAAFTLSWQAPADCPAPGDVRAEVARLLSGQIRLPAGRDFKAADLSGCFNLGQEVWAFGPCADAESGVVSARGVKVDQSLPAHRPWLAIGAGGYAAVSLSHRWSIPVHVAVLVPLVRPEYIFKDVPDWVFQAAPLGFASAPASSSAFRSGFKKL
jgi:hypothetical protein